MKAANNALKGNRFAAAASKVAVVCGNTVPDGKMGFLVAAAWRYCRIIPAGKASGGADDPSPCPIFVRLCAVFIVYYPESVMKIAASKIRIIGGKHRGRRIAVPEREGLRPTPDRVRETVFNWLQWEINGAYVLDAFAGSGALGLEALSRGAASVLFVEREADAAARLRTLLAEWQEAHTRVLQGDALHLTPGTRYDVIFLDPPFADGVHAQALTHFLHDGWLKPHGKVYVEMPCAHGELPLPANWIWHRQGRAGRVHFGLLRREVAA